MEKILEVKDLTINFRTINGEVQAVRGVSFDLLKGETMAIVGESGSGKSVTSRAILGILANNAIVKNGKIFFDGKDLLKTPEEQFHKIRGDKIAMIFQDPMSSLNPIMRIGKQLTEAMILKNKANRKESRKAFNDEMAKLVHYMNMCVINPEISNQQKADDFNKFEFCHLDLENAYNTAKSAGEDVLSILKNIMFEIEKNKYDNVLRSFKDIYRFAPMTCNRFFVPDTTVILQQIEELKAKMKTIKQTQDYKGFLPNLETIRVEIEKGMERKAPNFFSLGYYLTFCNPEMPDLSIEELDVVTYARLDEDFMFEFIERTKKALEVSHKESVEKTKELIADLETLEEKVRSDASDLLKYAEEVTKKTTDSIDKLDIYRRSPAYTFGSIVLSGINLYLQVDELNAKATAKFNKEKEKYDKIVSKGKTPNWALVPKTLWDKEQVRSNLLDNISDMIKYAKEFTSEYTPDYGKQAVDLIDFFKANASAVVNKVTKESAKTKAIKLMEEVGIQDAYKRYNQYPFEFSGGMRQRIVIAIALAANPQILICDEPTTALDVTIQSQILELINKLKVERNLSIIFITHDMGVVANMADRISVMYAGKIVETGTSDDIFYDPKHPYTWALLSSMPDLDTKEKLDSIPGTPPNMITPPIGDAFAARNKYALKIDYEQEPPMFKVSDTHYAATWLLHPKAPKVEMPKSLVDRIERMKKRNGSSEVKENE